METKFTKGEWKIFKPKGGCAHTVTSKDYEGYSRTIAIAYPVNQKNPINCLNDDEKVEAEANAKLIATAPELLQALNFSLSIIDRLCDDYSEIANKHANFTMEEFNKIMDVIKKATE